MEYHAHSAVNQFPESRISVTCPLPAGARRKLSRPSSFQPRECQGICAYCCVDDWLCDVQRIFAICEHHDAGLSCWVGHHKSFEVAVIAPMPEQDALMFALNAPS